MPNQTIGITLAWGPAQGKLADYDLNQLGTLIAAQLSAAIRADITFVPQVVNDPAAFDGQLIFNIPERVFKGWDIGTGRYVAVTEFTIGDIKNTFVGTDDIARGWVILNGRLIANISGISGAQQAALESIFGAGGSLPTVSPANVNGLPIGNAFGNIPWTPNLAPTFLPGEGVIAPGLTFSNPITGGEGQALADQTEILRASSRDSFDVTKQIQAMCQKLLTALNETSNPPIYAAIFAGYA